MSKKKLNLNLFIANHLTTIQNLNVYSHSYMAKIMMEIQQSVIHE